MTAEQFAQAYRTDASEAFTRVVEGLGASGAAAFKTLDDLGIGNERVIRSFLSLAGAGDKMRETFDDAAGLWVEQNALAREAAERFKTTASQVTLLENLVRDL